ncbi:hypothetical protein SPRG_14531 [Saprolegnia parasitica CBS 223.65]|uniref:EF-hand domain-containing protein n=1 Tax=Saprolegnia parasitica (strain CBS 223.65) TaxID=695850 RepID=A0A067BPN1_SAPPC|nr:hypothetical protein SPRG_14531 [Saprolegnia parasitica CBS 223.65]KDO20183.1 hypothetical protein SPRG_14531 [Saprolegnia parasitica CBS 223.65]|eukprot:XP_012209130.1 hypothetical protein SPRG_14531 [Saprolegnia parasitica CBS 223.65]
MSRRSISMATTERAYRDLLTTVEAQKVATKKASEALQEQSALTTLATELDWLKKRKARAHMRVQKRCDHLKHLRLWFDSYDVDKSGGISVQELLWPMLVLGFANTLAEVKALLVAADSDGDGQIGFDDFVELMNAHDTNGKDSVHPLEKLVHLVETGQLGDRSLSLQTLLPSYQRQLMLSALMSYGDVATTRAGMAAREANEAVLKRATIALGASKDLGSPLQRTPPLPRKKASVVMPKLSVLSPVVVQRRLVYESKKERRAHASEDNTMHLFLENMLATGPSDAGRRSSADAAIQSSAR